MMRRNSVNSERGANRWRRFALARVFSSGSSAADIADASCMYGIGAVAAPMHATFVRATMMVAGSIASALAAARYRRVGQELLKVIAPLGVEASLRALGGAERGGAAQRTALSRKLEQLVYEAKKAFEQYDAVDARNRLAASELERRWNEKLEEIEAVKRQLSTLDAHAAGYRPKRKPEYVRWVITLRGVRQSNHCPPTWKKMIFRTAIEEIIVRTDRIKRPLSW